MLTVTETVVKDLKMDRCADIWFKTTDYSHLPYLQMSTGTFYTQIAGNFTEPNSGGVFPLIYYQLCLRSVHANSCSLTFSSLCFQCDQTLYAIIVAKRLLTKLYGDLYAILLYNLLNKVSF